MLLLISLKHFNSLWKSIKSFSWICFGEADFNKENVKRWTFRGNKVLTFRWSVSAFDHRAWSAYVYIRAVCCWCCLNLARCLVGLWYRFHPSCKGQMKCLKVSSRECDGFFIRNPARSFPTLTSIVSRGGTMLWDFVRVTGDFICYICFIVTLKINELI